MPTLMQSLEQNQRTGNALLFQNQKQLSQLSKQMEDLNFQAENAARIQNEQLRILTLQELDRQRQKTMKNRVFLMKRAFDAVLDQPNALSRFLLLDYLFQGALEPNLSMLDHLSEISDKDYFYRLSREVEKEKNQILESLSQEEQNTAREFHRLFALTRSLPKEINDKEQEREKWLKKQKNLSQETIAPHALTILSGITGIALLVIFVFFGIPGVAALGGALWIEIKHRKKEKAKIEARMNECQSKIDELTAWIADKRHEETQVKNSLYAIADLRILDSLGL